MIQKFLVFLIFFQIFPFTTVALVKETWGDCTPATCSKLTVNVLDGKDGVWFVEAIYEGMGDDSIQAQKKIARAHYVDKSWVLGKEMVIMYRCQPGRGHQHFSSEPCL